MTHPPPPSDVGGSAGPDWSEIAHDVICPLCGYNLRGLNTPRCPECGFGFEWPEVLDPNRQKHEYLFEHHPERNAYSLMRTIGGAWRPRKFWQSLHPSQTSHFRRLVLYGILTALPLLIVITAQIAALACTSRNQSIQQRKEYRREIEVHPFRDQLLSSYGSMEAYLDRFRPVPDLEKLLEEVYSNAYAGKLTVLERTILPLCLGIPLLWPVLTLAALMIFRISMRRAHIRTVHVLRCVAYSLDGILWSTALLLAGVYIALFISDSGAQDSMEFGLLLGLMLAVVLGSYRLWAAYRYYLRFDRPFATVLATQVITILATATLVSAYDWRLSNRLTQAIGLVKAAYWQL